uniref:Integrase catalytic domain-containing protein n=1 Tax=Tanacetum cinerariifolium TaxID=118510 RepID=A0A699J9V2_TANCI|nr:hypothetical protein [Tanacetum cinerariifolium]
MNAASCVKRPMNRGSHDKNSVLANSKNSTKKVAVYVRKNKETNNTSANVISNKENVIDVDVVNASKAKNLLCPLSLEHQNLQTLPVNLNVHNSCSSEKHQFLLRNSGCSKHMTGDRSLLRNFIEKFMGTVRFGNDKFSAITGYGDYIQGNITIFHVYYVEGLGHNLSSVGQFCDGDLEVAFRSKTCYVRNLERDDLLTRGRKSNLYTISISDGCLFTCLSDVQSNFDKFKYEMDHLCSACERGKSKKASLPSKLVSSDNSKLELLHMDLCGLMRVASINGKKYILVIVDDYSRYTWVYFLHSKDETPEIIKKFIAQAQLNYKAKICKIRTNNGTEFKNANLKAYYEKLGIMQQFSIPELQRFNNHNSSVERMNTPSKEDLDNLFGSMFEEYFGKKSSKTPINSAAQPTQLYEDSPSASSISVEEHEAPPIETTSDEQTSPISLPEADELHQEDFANFDGNSQFVSYNPTSYEAIKSSSTALELSNVQNFHQVQTLTHSKRKDHPLDQVIGDPSKSVMTRQRLHTDSEVCMYALTVSTIEPKNIKEAMADHSWIESMQDELNQFERLQVWELIPRPEGKNIIALK